MTNFKLITAALIIKYNCNFTGNNATHGGAVFFYEDGDGDVTNCNFTNNTATNGYGGAVYFYWDGTVTNCNFIGNNATYYGGAIYFSFSGTTHEVRNCNFTNNKASGDGGAIDFEGTGTVTNCNFTDNKATSGSGGAIWMSSGSVENCNFINNTAHYAGAIGMGSGNVINCNFTGNNATRGSAIYFYSTSSTKTVFNSRFLNNRANAEELQVTKNENNITIIFKGHNNLLNAIYSRNDAEVTFINVTYWGAKGINNTGSSEIKPSRSKNESGQNITVGIVVNGILVLNEVKVTDENGMIVLPIKIESENYYIGARHDKDSYYTEAETTISNNTKFNVNVTSQTTTNKTVNITAKSNIYSEVMPGKLLFILPNSEEISANYGGNGTWWAVHTFDDYGVYEVNASYTGLDNVTVNNGTVTINDVRLSVVKSADTTEVVYNSTVQFTINVTNHGSTDATSVEVSDWLPEGLTFIEAGVINSEGQYEVFDSPDLFILIGDEESVTFFEFSSSDIIEDGGVERDIAQWSITRIASGNSVILLITARANGLVMGNITNEVTVWYHENETDSIVNSTNITVIPANSSVSAEDVEVTYGDTIEVVVTSENATGISYKVIGKDGVVKEGTVNVGENITGLDLAVGDYTVNLTTMVNGNYTAANYTSKITVKPANSTVKAEDVEVT
ncbi:right-handed parallel beta-helix repeat-containing protein, partial [Methanobrevibacter sp.]|uniref:right-handed parallel beta-helix repeat-containing protein n=1 Tax=Methanobrevibacter sp. TaxID=66852 RepID=UPI00388E9D40